MQTRRHFLRAGGSALALSLAAVCAPEPSPSTPPAGKPTNSPASTAVLPTYVPFQGPKPDFSPSADGIVPAGYLTFPQTLVKSTSGPVGKASEEVNFICYSINPTPAPADQNPAWQQVNKDLGLDLKFTYTALQDYNVKLNTVIASGQLPDIFTMNVLGVLIANEIDFFQTQCADLTPFISGDAIKAFPNLANLPQTAWRNCIFNGKFYGLPRVVNAVGSTLLVQQNLLDEIGVTAIKNKDDFSKVVKDTTRNNIYGMGGMQANTMQWMLEMFRAPNQWRQTGGKFTRDWETPEYKEAVALLKSFWDPGYVHPDTPTYTQQQGAQPFSAGKGVQFQDWGGNQITVLKKGSPERIQQVLGVLNYLASPFGSQEYLNLWYGQKGIHFNFDEKGNPVYTQAGQNNVQYIAWQTIVSPPPVLFDALDPNFVKLAHPIETAAHELAVTDPTVGLYSPTYATKGASLTMAMTDGVNGILFGRADLNSLDALVKTWRANGGDQIKNEYEEAIQRSRQ